MPLEDRARLHTSSKPALDLPPPFRLVTLREVGDAFVHATSAAAEEGAGGGAVRPRGGCLQVVARFGPKNINNYPRSGVGPGF